MRAVVLEHQSPQGPVAPQVHAVSDWPDPGDPAAGEVRLRTLYSALNHMDLWVGHGIPGVEIAYPHVSGVEACAVVEATGAGVDASWLNRRVVVNSALRQPERNLPGDAPAGSLAPAYRLIGEHSPGMHREYFLAPATQLAVVDEADPAAAAAFGLATLTAYSMMCTKGRLRPGQRVLIPGIGGGVASAALGLARWLGCRVAVTSRHPWKLERAVELGAELTVLDRGEDWSGAVRSWSGKRGVDMAVDTVGDRVHRLCLQSLARGGAYVTAGATAGPSTSTHLGRIFWNQLRILGSTMGDPSEFREVVALFRAGLVEPVIDSVHQWSEPRPAWERLEAAEQFGKIVLRWGE